MTLHIVTGSDDNYVAGVLVLIASAAFHNPDTRFTVLDLGISPANRARLDALEQRIGCPVQRIEVPADAFDHVPVRRAHLTRGTFLRLLIPQLLPDADRVLYMDCDMVVLGDLSGLADLPLGTDLFAAVPCPSPTQSALDATGVPAGSYVNAGLLLMNLPVWRAENTAERCLARLTGEEQPVLSGDEAALNLLGRGRVTALPAGMNVYSDPAAYASTGTPPEDVRVVHYVVNNKPWNGPMPLGRLWWFHANRIADLLPPARPVTLRTRLRRANRARRRAMGLMLGRRKYRVRRDVAHIAERMADAYLARWQGHGGPADHGRAPGVSGR